MEDKSIFKLTSHEEDAVTRELASLSGVDNSYEAFVAAATAGPCFCAGRFICTKHLVERERTAT